MVRARSQLEPIIPALQKHGLDMQATNIDALSERPEIRDLLTLTFALHHRADRVAWLSLLRAPWCGLTLADLDVIANHAPAKTIWETLLNIENIVISSDGMRRAKWLRYQLNHAFQKQTQLTLSAWVEGVWLGLNGPACLTNQSELDNINAFFTLLSSIEVSTFSNELLIEK